jgi:glycosyltransferase involved in cell wall biosynthesis
VIDGRTLAAVVPAYRVERQIGGVLEAMPPEIDLVFVVDDASPDHTGTAVRAIGDSRIRLIRHEKNRGVGGAMASGFRAALLERADIIVKCDGDGQMDPQQIPRLVAPLVSGQADYAKGCRFYQFAELRAMPRARFVGNIGLTFLTKLASGYWHVLDPQNGFIAVRSDFLRRIPLERLARGYFFENDMLIRLNCVEARVLDVPMPARYGAEPSSLNPWRILVSFPARLLAGFFRRLFWRYLVFDVSPVAVFFLAGLALASFGAAFGSFHWIRNATRGVATPTGTVILAAVPFILGVQLLLQAVVLDIQNTPRSSQPPGPAGVSGGVGAPPEAARHASAPPSD